MSLSIISIDKMVEWDEIVRSFKDYDVYYLSGYVKAFNLHGDGEPLLFYFDNGNTRAINVVMKRDISLDKRFNEKIPTDTYFDFATPYGYGGFLIEGEDYEQVNEEYSKYCTENGIVSEFVRFSPILNNVESSKFVYDISHCGNTVAIDLTDINAIWDNLSSKNRNMIRKAQKSGIKIYWGRDEQLLQEFKLIYDDTMDRDMAKPYYYFDDVFYKSVLNDLKNNAMFFYAKIDGKIVAISIIMFCNSKVHYHLSASRKEYRQYAPTNLLLYEVACYASANGYSTFHLGGGLGAHEDGLYKFKKGFNKNKDGKFYIGKKVFNQDVYDKLMELRKSDKEFNTETTFFPGYRG